MAEKNKALERQQFIEFIHLGISNALAFNQAELNKGIQEAFFFPITGVEKLRRLLEKIGDAEDE
jgi:hypothetical protein